MRSRLAVTLLLLLAACGGSDAADDSTTTTTSTSAATTSTTSTSTTTTSTTTTSTTSTTLPEAEPAIATELCVLGWWQDGAWVQAYGAATPPPAGAGDPWRVVDAGGDTGSTTGSDPIEGDDVYLPAWVVEFDPGIGRDVAVSGTHPLVPRPVLAQDPDQDVYRDAVADLLALRGYDDVPIEMVQVIRFDLEGDGVEEALVTARHPGAPTFDREPGVFSLVFLRRLIEGTVETAIIHESIYTEEDLELATSVDYGEVAAVADLNGDGTLEIVVAGGYYEGSWAFAVEYQGDDLGPVDVMGCGAGV